MDNYEIFKIQFFDGIKEMIPIMPIDELNTIMIILDQIAIDYDINKKSTEIIVSDEGIPEVVKLFLTALAIEDKSIGTLKDYRGHLTRLFKILRKPFNQITTNELRVYLYNYKTTRGVENSTLDHVRIVINAFYNWCKREGYVENNPCETIRAIKTQEKKREPLDQMELELIRQACETPREKALVDFLYSTGCRVEECAQMKLEDINWKNHSAIVQHGKGDKQRMVYLNPECELSLKKYLKERVNQTDYVFSPSRKIKKPYMSRNSIETIIRTIAKRANLPSGKHVTPHIFRHTTATIALANGMPIEQVQKMLGHEQLDTTMIYAKINEDAVHESHKKFVT